MGTRADFYVGLGKEAEWLGSVAYDGHPGNFPTIEKAKTEKGFRSAVEKMLKHDEHATFPKEGWPWPWKNSDLTDYSYAWDGNNKRCLRTEFENDTPTAQKIWLDASDGRKRTPVGKCIWPDMSKRMKMKVKPPGSPGSGSMLFGLALLTLLLVGCEEFGPEQTEPGHAEDMMFLPAQHGTSITPGAKNPFGFVDIAPTYGVVFSCDHGRFAVQGSDDRHKTLWTRFQKGQAVVIHYRTSTKGRMDFLDAVAAP